MSAYSYPTVRSYRAPRVSRWRSLVATDRLTIVPVRRMWTDGSLPGGPDPGNFPKQQ